MAADQSDIDRHYCKSLRECFYFDVTEINPLPSSMLKMFLAIILSANYSTPVLMRISQFFYRRNCKFLSAVIRRLNQILNSFTHGADPLIHRGVSFHHINIAITTHAIIESGVHIYGGVTLGMKNNAAPQIKSGAKLCANSVVIGNVIVGEKSIVAPCAVVINDVPSGTIFGGVPAKKIGDVNSTNYLF